MAKIYTIGQIVEEYEKENGRIRVETEEEKLPEAGGVRKNREPAPVQERSGRRENLTASAPAASAEPEQDLDKTQIFTPLRRNSKGEYTADGYSAGQNTADRFQPESSAGEYVTAPVLRPVPAAAPVGKKETAGTGAEDNRISDTGNAASQKAEEVFEFFTEEELPSEKVEEEIPAEQEPEEAAAPVMDVEAFSFSDEADREAENAESPAAVPETEEATEESPVTVPETEEAAEESPAAVPETEETAEEEIAAVPETEEAAEESPVTVPEPEETAEEDIAAVPETEEAAQEGPAAAAGGEEKGAPGKTEQPFPSGEEDNGEPAFEFTEEERKPEASAARIRSVSYDLSGRSSGSDLDWSQKRRSTPGRREEDSLETNPFDEEEAGGRQERSGAAGRRREQTEDRDADLDAQEEEYSAREEDKRRRQEERTARRRDQKAQKEEKEEKPATVGSVIREFLIYAVIFAVCVFLIPRYVMQRTEVSGISMEDTLQDGDNLIVEKVSRYFTEMKRFDVIVFYPYGKDVNEYYIKRVIGLPGETVQIIGSDIYINGTVLEEDYGKEPITYAGIAAQPITLGDGQYFVLGDNREESFDSRYEEVGVVDQDQIAGHALFRIWPLSSFGNFDKGK